MTTQIKRLILQGLIISAVIVTGTLAVHAQAVNNAIKTADVSQASEQPVYEVKSTFVEPKTTTISVNAPVDNAPAQNNSLPHNAPAASTAATYTYQAPTSTVKLDRYETVPMYSEDEIRNSCTQIGAVDQYRYDNCVQKLSAVTAQRKIVE